MNGCASAANFDPKSAKETLNRWIAAVMFISARTERMAVTRSMTQPISASALSSERPVATARH